MSTPARSQVVVQVGPPETTVRVAEGLVGREGGDLEDTFSTLDSGSMGLGCPHTLVLGLLFPWGTQDCGWVGGGDITFPRLECPLTQQETRALALTAPHPQLLGCVSGEHFITLCVCFPAWKKGHHVPAETALRALGVLFSAFSAHLLASCFCLFSQSGSVTFPLVPPSRRSAGTQ